jgi:hypothetical protein
MPVCGTVIIDFREHALDVGFLLGEGTDGADACESGAELFEDGRFGIRFESFYFARPKEVDGCYVDADCEKRD